MIVSVNLRFPETKTVLLQLSGSASRDLFSKAFGQFVTLESFRIEQYSRILHSHNHQITWTHNSFCFGNSSHKCGRYDHCNDGVFVVNRNEETRKFSRI